MNVLWRVGRSNVQVLGAVQRRVEQILQVTMRWCFEPFEPAVSARKWSRYRTGSQTFLALVPDPVPRKAGRNIGRSPDRDPALVTHILQRLLLSSRQARAFRMDRLIDQRADLRRIEPQTGACDAVQRRPAQMSFDMDMRPFREGRQRLLWEMGSVVGRRFLWGGRDSCNAGRDLSCGESW